MEFQCICFTKTFYLLSFEIINSIILLFYIYNSKLDRYNRYEAERATVYSFNIRYIITFSFRYYYTGLLANTNVTELIQLIYNSVTLIHVFNSRHLDRDARNWNRLEGNELKLKFHNFIIGGAMTACSRSIIVIQIVDMFQEHNNN